MRIDIPDDKKLVHEMVIPVRWSDMDAMGHVNNANYFRYMEAARIEWLSSIDCRPNARGEGVVIVNAFCNFHRQFEYPANVLIKTYVGALGRTSFETWVTMEKAGQPGELYASGGATTVWVDAQAQKSVPLPGRLRQILSE
ncbi:MAG: acyl-CoA thioesterase [Desulfovibrionaceae bacterium]|jgi:acyl-CoA thioester hydrolase|nr:acyl-CoA thioesterase [Desulfovibrionaceae bacterium]